VQRLTVVMTPTAADLVGTSAVAVAAQVEPLVGWGRIPVHVELARSIDCALVAPATATTLARLAAGDASNLLLATLLATTAPVHVYPSMNREMWEKPAVRRNVSVLEGDGLVVVPPVLGPRIGVPGGATETGSIGLTPAALAELLDHWTQER
jgi:phosphopantothenoylcysteine decarboxylase/phosphopantothenate--cysteine ligase